MIKVTLLGDSIRMLGYGKLVPKLLGEQYEVYQPDDNCRFAKYTLRGLFDWKQDMADSRIVHWNNGLWDVCEYFGDGLFTDEDEYVKTMLRIADILVSRYDKVIFATTTPVKEKYAHITNANIEKYNSIIVPLLEEKGIVINDLHSIVSEDVERYIRSDDNIHLTDDGIEICAKQVADVVQKVSMTLDDSKQRSYDVNPDKTGFPI